MITKSAKFPFGLYKGETVQHVFEKDPTNLLDSKNNKAMRKRFKPFYRSVDKFLTPERLGNMDLRMNWKPGKERVPPIR